MPKGFQKGHKPFNPFKVGHPDFVSKEARKRAGIKIAIAQKGKVASQETREKQRLSAIKRGSNVPRRGKNVICPVCGKEKYKCPRDIRRGSKFCSKGCAYETFKGVRHSPQSEFKKGRPKELHHNWKGGITPENNRLRGSEEGRKWIALVLTRDKKCQRCGDKRKSNLVAHHIKNFSQHKELRFVVDNGIMLCRPCHKEFHRVYGKQDNSMVQIKEFIACGQVAQYL